MVHAYSTKTNTYLMITLRALLFLGGLGAFIPQMINILSGSQIYFGLAFLGAYFINMAIFFDYHFRNNQLVIGPTEIRHRRFKTIFRSERNVEVRWKDIEQITVHTWSVHITVMEGIVLKFKLPNYNYSQFQSIKQQLDTLTQQKDIALQIKSWW